MSNLMLRHIEEVKKYDRCRSNPECEYITDDLLDQMVFLESRCKKYYKGCKQFQLRSKTMAKDQRQYHSAEELERLWNSIPKTLPKHERVTENDPMTSSAAAAGITC